MTTTDHDAPAASVSDRRLPSRRWRHALLAVAVAAPLAVLVTVAVVASSRGGDLVPSASDVGPEYHADRVIVAVDADAGDPDAAAARLGDARPLDLVDDDGNPLYAVDTSSAPSTLRTASVDGDVVDASPDPVVETQQVPGVDDPRLREQWALMELEIAHLWSDDGIWLDDSPTIAVLDTGVESTPSLPGERILDGWDVVNDAPHSGDVDGDARGHGTRVAEIAAGDAGNGYGAAGVCPSCEVLPVAVLSTHGGSSSDVAAGISYAVEHGADVINMSLGAQADDPATRAAVRDAVDAGVVVVAAAGNYGQPRPTYPAAYDEVLAVGGLDDDDRRRRHAQSNYGSRVGTSAPFCNPVGEEARFCGTSGASPVVAGVAGILSSRHPDATDVVADVIRDTGGQADGFAGRLKARTADAALGDADTPDDGGDGGGLPDGSEVARLAGGDRYATAARIATGEWGHGVDRVVVATGREFPDALTAGAALRGGGPVLLVEPDAVPASTRETLSFLAPGEVVVAGGTSAVSSAVLDELSGYAPTRRVAGDDRVATAAALADDAFGDAHTAVIVDGWDADAALDASAYAARQGAPALLARDGEVPQATRDALASLGVVRVVLHGSFDREVRTGLVDEFEEVVVRDDDVPPGLAGEALLARDDDHADALAGTALVAARDAALVRVDRDGLTDAQEDALATVAPQRLTALGGPAALPDRVLGDAARAAMIGE